VATDRILVVEDDQQIQAFLSRVLEGSGYSVLTAGSGASAVTSAAKERPSLVILDLRLPDMNGYQVCNILRKMFYPSAMPILMLTALNQPIDQLRGYAHGADAYMTKPCEPPDLLRTITMLLEQPDTGSA